MTSAVRWAFEDELPEMPREDFDLIFKASRVDVVRLYPFVEDQKGNRIWITHLPGQEEYTHSEPVRYEMEGHTDVRSDDSAFGHPGIDWCESCGAAYGSKAWKSGCVPRPV